MDKPTTAPESFFKKLDYIDLRDVISELDGIGFKWFALRQADLSKSCECINDNSKGIRQARADCKRCLGGGYLFTDHLVRAYDWAYTPGTQFQTEVGPLATQVRNFVVQFSRVLNKFDYILDLDRVNDTGAVRQPFKVMRVFQIQDTMQLTGKSGRTEFWKCVAEERTFNFGKTNIEGTNYSHKVYV